MWGNDNRNILFYGPLCEGISLCLTPGKLIKYDLQDDKRSKVLR